MNRQGNDGALALARELLISCSAFMDFSLQGFSVLVKSDSPEPLDWLHAFAAPCFASTGAETADWVVGYRCDPGAFKKMEELLSDSPTKEIVSRIRRTQVFVHREYLLSDMRALRNDEFDAFCFAWPVIGEMLILAREDDADSREYLARAVRKLTTLHHERLGRVVTHSCAFLKNGKVTLGVAESKGGKTTFLLQNLLAGADFVSNERVLLIRQDGGILAHGLPNKISLRPGTIACFPTLRERIDSESNLGRLEYSAVTGKYRFSGSQLCGLANAGMIPGGPLKEIAFLSRGGTDEGDIGRDEAAALLKKQVFDYAERPRVFFSSLCPVDMEKFRKDADDLCEVLLDSCRYYRKTWQPKLHRAPAPDAQAIADTKRGILER